MSLPPPTHRRSRRTTALHIVIAIIGGMLLLVTVRRVGWSEVQSGLAQVGWWFPVMVLLGGLRFAARARAWMVCADAVTHFGLTTRTPHPAPGTPTPHPAPGTRTQHPAPGTRTPHPALRTRHFWTAVLAADALGNLTPLGLLASEPAKIWLVRSQLPTVTAIVSVAAENAFYMTSAVTMIAAGAAVFISLTSLPAGLRSAVQAVLAGAVVSGVAAVLIARRKPAVLSRLAPILSALTGRVHTSAGHLQDVEALFYGILRWPANRLARAMTWEALFHVAAVAEVFLVLRLLPGADQPSLTDAFVLETTGRLIAVAFKFVPYRLGVDEAGTALVAGALSLDPTAGVTLALVRRMRILCWNAVGLMVLARSR